MKLMADNYDDDHHHYHHHHHHHHHRSPGRPQHSNHRPSPDQLSEELVKEEEKTYHWNVTMIIYCIGSPNMTMISWRRSQMQKMNAKVDI